MPRSTSGAPVAAQTESTNQKGKTTMSYRRESKGYDEQRTEQVEGPSYPAAALDAAIEAARLAEPVIEGPHGVRHAFVPAGFALQELRDAYALPPRIEQRVVVDDAESLITYANRFSDGRSIIIADLDALKITVELDWHRSNQDAAGILEAQACEHKAVLAMRNSEEFARWAEMEGKLHEQVAFAEFLDENASDIVSPEPAEMIAIARDLEATQSANFKSANRLENGDRTFRYETETHVKGDVQIPTRFYLSIPLFFGEEPTQVEAAFRFRPNADGLKLGFVWRRVEYVRQAQFRQIAFRVAELTGHPVYFGRRG